MHSSFLPAAVLAAGCALLVGRTTHVEAATARPLSTLPHRIGDFSGTDGQLAEEERRVAGVSSYLLRSYRDPDGAGWSLYVGYYARQTRGQTIHSPKSCLPGSGWEVVGAGTESVDTPDGRVVVNRYWLTRDDTRALVYYWYQGRGRVVSNEYVVKWNLLRDAALLGRSEEALVRIVVPIAAEGGARTAEEADALAREAVRTLVPAVADVLPAVGA